MIYTLLFNYTYIHYIITFEIFHLTICFSLTLFLFILLPLWVASRVSLMSLFCKIYISLWWGTHWSFLGACNTRDRAQGSSNQSQCSNHLSYILNSVSHSFENWDLDILDGAQGILLVCTQQWPLVMLSVVQWLNHQSAAMQGKRLNPCIISSVLGFILKYIFLYTFSDYITFDSKYVRFVLQHLYYCATKFQWIVLNIRI